MNTARDIAYDIVRKAGLAFVIEGCALQKAIEAAIENERFALAPGAAKGDGE